jgi:hypothetical protein
MLKRNHPKNTMASQKIADINAEIEKMRRNELELIKRREALLVDEAVRHAEAAQLSAATQVAQALINVHTEHDVNLETLFGIQSAEVNTAGLILLAEWRGAKTTEMFLKNGADVNAKDKAGFSVLEYVLQGHDGYWRGDSPHWNPEVFEVLAKYNVSRTVAHDWIIDECCKGAPKYVLDFLGTDV